MALYTKTISHTFYVEVLLNVPLLFSHLIEFEAPKLEKTAEKRQHKIRISEFDNHKQNTKAKN